MQVESLGWEDLLEKEIANHSSILARKISWTEEPSMLHSMRSQESDTTYFINLLCMSTCARCCGSTRYCVSLFSRLYFT